MILLRPTVEEIRILKNGYQHLMREDPESDHGKIMCFFLK